MQGRCPAQGGCHLKQSTGSTHLSHQSLSFEECATNDAMHAFALNQCMQLTSVELLLVRIDDTARPLRSSDQKNLTYISRKCPAQKHSAEALPTKGKFMCNLALSAWCTCGGV
jgi:hypothetical protein